MNPQAIRIADYTYTLPDEQIAVYPAENRDEAKVLVYKDGANSSTLFKNLPELLPEGALLVFNNTRVIQARILFIGEKDTIEVFCLEPFEEELTLEKAMAVKRHATWKCLIGNNKRWKDLPQVGTFSLNGQNVKLIAEKLRKEDDVFIVKFSWEPADLSFAEVLEVTGKIPLPPYIKRETEEIDKSRYQTVYAKAHGSVAAPTSGLHFTQTVLDGLTQKGITTTEITLHVGAGTFKPVKVEYLKEHEMHAEQVQITRDFIDTLLENMGKNPIIAVGTTSARTLESLYWFGLKLRYSEVGEKLDIDIGQWEPYEINPSLHMEPRKAIEAISTYMKKNKLEEVHGKTKLLIAPGYKFKLVDGLITNFHQPQSTLLLLIAAFIGQGWKDMYKYALANNFRFLSYGDSSLLFKNS